MNTTTKKGNKERGRKAEERGRRKESETKLELGTANATHMQRVAIVGVASITPVHPPISTHPILSDPIPSP